MIGCSSINILSYSHAYMGGGHNGGAETTLHDIMRMHRLDKDVTTGLVSKPHPDGSGSYVLDGVMVQAYSNKRDPELYFPTADIIISHLECAARSGMISRKLGKPAIHLLHNDQPYCVTAAEKYADALIFNTEWIKGAYANCEVPSVVLHPPVAPDRYTTSSSRDYITIVNLTIGDSDRISYDKGARTFYELARRFPNEKFLGVQGGYGDQYIPENLPSNVTILPHLHNTKDAYAKTKILLVPSTYESYGRAAIEAACSGIPTSSTDTLGTREGIGVGGTLVDGSDIEDWTASLDDILSAYTHKSAAARDRAHALWDRTLVEWEDYKDMIAQLT